MKKECDRNRPERVLLLLSILTAVLYFAVSGNYGIFRDELYYFACGEHLDWGYVDHPPMVAAIAALARTIFGDWLPGLRLPATLAISATVYLSGVIALQLGGRRNAQILAALVAMLAPVYQGMSNYLSMNAFDLLFWAALISLFIEYIKAEEPRHWVAIGGVTGLALLNKYSVLFLIAAFVLGMLLTRFRKHLLTPYPYIGGAIALLILTPNIWWQTVRGWPFMAFQAHTTERTMGWMSLPQFMMEQVLMMHPFSIIVWLAGLAALLFWKPLRPYRLLGITWLIALALYLLKGSKTYYPAPSYLLLFPAGAVFIEHFFRSRNWKWGAPALMIVLVITGLIVLPYGLPVLPVETYISYDETLALRGRHYFEDGRPIPLQQHYADRFGWEEMVQRVAAAYHSLPEDEQRTTAIYGSNYGNAGAVDFFREKYDLPSAVSMHLTYWYWGLPEGEITTMITCGRNSKEELEQLFAEVVPAGMVDHPYALFYERQYEIYICRGPLVDMKPLWQQAGMQF